MASACTCLHCKLTGWRVCFPSRGVAMRRTNIEQEKLKCAHCLRLYTVRRCHHLYHHPSNRSITHLLLDRNVREACMPWWASVLLCLTPTTHAGILIKAFNKICQASTLRTKRALQRCVALLTYLFHIRSKIPPSCYATVAKNIFISNDWPQVYVPWSLWHPAYENGPAAMCGPAHICISYPSGGLLSIFPIRQRPYERQAQIKYHCTNCQVNVFKKTTSTSGGLQHLLHGVQSFCVSILAWNHLPLQAIPALLHSLLGCAWIASLASRCVTIRTYTTDFYLLRCTNTGVIMTHAFIFLPASGPIVLTDSCAARCCDSELRLTVHCCALWLIVLVTPIVRVTLLFSYSI